MSNKSNKKVIDICPICETSKTLVKSHIIPEGFYRKIYDEKGRALFGSEMRSEAGYVQKGRREYLLCSECDGGLGDYDKYAKEVILDNIKIRKQRISGGKTIEGIDYNKFKLFHLSILLRAHFSKEVSLGVKLSKQEEEEILKYISQKKAPGKYKYPIFAYKLTDGENSYDYDGIITYGNFFEIEDRIKVCVFIFGGFAWNYILTDINPKLWCESGLKNLFLDEDGKMIVLDYDIKNFFPLIYHQEYINRIINYKQRKNEKNRKRKNNNKISI